MQACCSTAAAAAAAELVGTGRQAICKGTLHAFNVKVVPLNVAQIQSARASVCI
jgi:hypothetical protein